MNDLGLFVGEVADGFVFVFLFVIKFVGFDAPFFFVPAHKVSGFIEAVWVFYVAKGADEAELLFAQGGVGLRDAGISGTATTLVDRQMEVYKKLPYPYLKLSAATVPGATDLYRTSPPANVAVAPATLVASTVTSAGGVTTGAVVSFTVMACRSNRLSRMARC